MNQPDEWPYRSLLFTPGHRLEWIRKAPRYRPDAVILDLEDAVPPHEKVAARAVTREGIAILRAAGIAPFVRINPQTLRDDVLGVMAKGLQAICLPKLDNVQQVRELADVLSYAEGQAGLPHGAVDIVAIPETAAGMCDVRQLAAASPRVKSVMTGINDRPSEDVVFQGDTAMAAGFIPTREGLEQVYLTSKVCLEARAGGAPYPVGAIIGTDLGDPEAARRIAQRLKACGFTGGVCIHPSHVAIANQVFGPSAQEVAFHAGVLQAMKNAEAQGQWAVNYRGIMIDRANVPIAERMLALARRYGMAVPE
ncbi:MAG TPA: CoA ester lyase [Ramlibacter sp.]|nr:CoA ester lyase [Ramlibacter sp.]